MMEWGQYGEAGNNNAMELESTNYTAVLLKDIETESISNTQSVTMSEVLIENNFEHRFSHLYSGPYYAYIQHQSKNIGRLHEMAIGRLLHEELGLKTGIKEISRAGYSRIKIEMRTLKDVINLVNDSRLKEKKLHCYVPRHLTECRGVIKFVDTSFTEEELLQSIECEGMVKSVKRIHRRIVKEDKSVQMVPRQTVKTICKAKEQRCKNCGDTHEGACNAGTMCIHLAEVEFRKKKTPNSSKPLVCWWNDKCKKAIDNRKDALGKYKSDPTLENFIRYKRISAETKKTFKSAARQSWKNFCESLNQDTPTDRIWKKLKAIKAQPSHNQPIPDVILEELLCKLAPFLILEELLCKLAPFSTELNFRSEPQINHILCEPFNYEELERALKNNSNTSPGADDIRYPMIQHLPLNAKKILLSMFNKIYLEGEEVQELKTGIIIPITKPGYHVKSPSDLRSITMLSCIIINTSGNRYRNYLHQK
ncbi:hypothetical protein QE152_g25334 [Popillia japonica]|uniref:Uncharacterized protein n=1 Tax=Popillia japonica TaxID=7064 RepID=A0AAW1K305_POPJA